MFFFNKQEIVCVKKTYEEPKITDLKVANTDIITESHFDPNMGEWDTE